MVTGIAVGDEACWRRHIGAQQDPLIRAGRIALGGVVVVSLLLVWRVEGIGIVAGGMSADHEALTVGQRNDGRVPPSAADRIAVGLEAKIVDPRPALLPRQVHPARPLAVVVSQVDALVRVRPAERAAGSQQPPVAEERLPAAEDVRVRQIARLEVLDRLVEPGCHAIEPAVRELLHADLTRGAPVAEVEHDAVGLSRQERCVNRDDLRVRVGRDHPAHPAQ